jgi:putative DNA primase/helicase
LANGSKLGLPTTSLLLACAMGATLEDLAQVPIQGYYALHAKPTSITILSFTISFLSLLSRVFRIVLFLEPTRPREEGQRLSQGKLKRITQGMGKIKAVRKYENPIEFLETHKLWMDTNTKPVIRAADDQATFNRLHPIPFTVTISSEEIDKSLPRKLLAEAEGILAWAVAGAVEWRRAGLGKPPEVSAANEDWKSENDQMGRFIEDCCVVNESLGGRARVLYTAYRSWAEDAGENAVSETMFGRRLKARGFSKVERRQGTVYTGIALRANAGSSEENQ